MEDISQRKKNKIASDYRENDDGKRDKGTTLIAVSVNPMLLSYADIRLKDDEDVVLSAVRIDGSAMRFASERLRGDISVVAAAVKNFPPSYAYALSPARDDEKIIETVAAFGGDIVAELPQSAKDKKSLALAAIKRNVNSLIYFSERVRGDKDVALAAVKIDRTSVKYLADEAFREREVFDEVLKAYDFTVKANVLNNDTPLGFIQAICERGMKINIASQNFDLIRIDRDKLYILLDVLCGAVPKRAELLHKYVVEDDRTIVEKMLKRKITPSDGLHGEVKFAAENGKRKVLPVLLMYSKKTTSRPVIGERDKLLSRLKRKSLAAIKELKENIGAYLSDRDILLAAARVDGGILFYLNNSPYIVDNELIDLCLETYVVKNAEPPILKELTNLRLNKKQAVFVCKKDERNYPFLGKELRADEEVLSVLPIEEKVKD